jgi:hypothetical protein
MASNVATAERPKQETAAPAASPPVFISPGLCKKHEEVNTVWRITLPSAIKTVRAFYESPEIWRQVQSSDKALRRLDLVEAELADGSFLFVARVDRIDGPRVYLTKPQIIELTPRDEGMPTSSSGNYVVRFDVTGDAAGYCVFRTTDDRRMTPHRPTVDGAVQDMNNLKPRSGTYST